MNRHLDIEREVFIAASPEAVFRFLVEPAFMARWFGIRHALDPQPGGAFRVEVSAGLFASGTYVEVKPHSRVVFTWGWEGRDDLPPGRSTVAIDLVRKPGGTLLRLQHRGLPPETPSPFGPEDHGERWSHYLAQLAAQWPR